GRPTERLAQTVDALLVIVRDGMHRRAGTLNQRVDFATLRVCQLFAHARKIRAGPALDHFHFVPVASLVCILPRRMRLGLKQIEYFRAVMETGSVSGAATLLNVSQPNVSRMLKYTETRLGMPLFDRLKGRLQPTPEALALFREVQSLHAHLESLQESV